MRRTCSVTPHDFIDDVTGQSRDKTMAREARKLEMQFFRNVKVYDKVPRWMAARDGRKVFTTRWLDINKGDHRNPNYRARLVGWEIAIGVPANDVLCVREQPGQEESVQEMSIDVWRAHFIVMATRPVYIEIPIEDFEPGDEGKVARLNLRLYGTRGAAQNLAKEHTTFLEECGFMAGLASPCNFGHSSWELTLTVHGVDFTVTSSTADLQWMRRRMEKKYEMKSRT